MLTFSGLEKSFGGRTLFADAALALVAGDRVALVGPNGAGKSTLFRILLGHETADAGTVTWARGARIGFLPQESQPGGAESVLDIALGYVTEEPLPGSSGGAHPEFHHEIADGETVARAKRLLIGLGFKETDFERTASHLSGGWVMRARLARLLVDEPDLLLLDEPTNHLDLETVLWLQEYLQSYPGAILLISHDREFLNRLCSHVVEIRQSTLIKYTGNYDAYVEQRIAQEENQLAAYKSQQREIQRLQQFVDRFRAKNTKAAQAQSKLKQIERIKEEMIESPDGPAASVGFSFPQPERSGLKVVRLENVRFEYPATADRPPQVVYENINFEAERGQRIVLVGPNGAGKSTLLKLLAGVLTPTAGIHALGHNTRSGYFAQYRTQSLRSDRSVLEEALDTPQRVTEQFVRTVLGSFLFRGDDVFKPVSVLSGGEKSRLALVKLLLDPPNLLLMDEPTTHLDMASIDALVEALEPYEGTLIFISHDVHFIRSIAAHTVHVKSGRLMHYPGGYDYYLEKTNQDARAGLTGGGASPASARSLSEPAPAEGLSRKEQKRLEAEARQARSRERKAIQTGVDKLEKEIGELEAREKLLVAELEDPATYEAKGRAAEINRELADLHQRLPELHNQWEIEAGRLHQFEDLTD